MLQDDILRLKIIQREQESMCNAVWFCQDIVIGRAIKVYPDNSEKSLYVCKKHFIELEKDGYTRRITNEKDYREGI